MKLKTSLLCLSAIALAYYMGYRIGHSSASLDLSLAPSLVPSQTNEQSKNVSAITWLDKSPYKNTSSQNNHALVSELGIKPNAELGDDDSAPSQETSDALAQDTEFEWQNPDSIVAMFNELMSLSEPGTQQDMQSFSRAIDQLRNILAESPAQLATLVEHMQSLSFESKEFHYITAIMQGLPGDVGYEAMENVALQLGQRNDTESKQQFIHLVSNSYNSADNPEILSTLMNIALYSDTDRYTKLSALDLVMPFQITNVERQQIVANLNGMLELADNADKNEILNNVLRFSNTQEREELASSMIAKSNDTDVRYSILDSLHSGVIPRTPALKNQLLSVAKDPTDPLNEQAKHALMYVFDISNAEYQQIKTGR